MDHRHQTLPVAPESARGASVTSVPTPPPHRYLLFSGRHGTDGGVGGLRGTFHDESAARAAFTAVRLGSAGNAAWAELASIDYRGGCAVLCWFGHDRPVPSLRAAADSRPRGNDDYFVTPSRRRSFWRRGGPPAVQA